MDRHGAKRGIDDTPSGSDAEQGEAPPAHVRVRGTNFDKLFLAPLQKRRRTSTPPSHSTEGAPRVEEDAPASASASEEVDNSPLHDLRPSAPLIGFKSASGRSLAVGAASLAKARQILEECADGPPFQLPSSETEEPSALDDQPEQPFVGFTTGRGKRVKVSESSLEKAKRILRDDEKREQECSQGPPMPSEGQGFTTARGRKINTSEASLTRARARFFTEPEEGAKDDQALAAEKPVGEEGAAPVMVGFTTARGKRLEPSAANVELAMRKFFDADSGEERTHPSQSVSSPQTEEQQMPPQFVGFTTGHGRRLNPSAIKVEQAMNQMLVDDETPQARSKVSNNPDSDAMEAIDTSAPVGFTTGRGRRLSPPRASVEKALRSFLEDDDDDGSKLQRKHSQAFAADKEQTIRNENQMDHNSEDRGHHETAADSGRFSGFKTGSGKTVEVSAASLARSRKLLEDAETDETRLISSDAQSKLDGSSPVEEEMDDDAGMLLELSGFTSDEKDTSYSPPPRPSTASASSLNSHPPASTGPFNRPRPNAAGLLAKTNTSGFAYPNTPVRSTPPPPSGAVAVRANAATTTSRNPQRPSDVAPPSVTVTTPARYDSQHPAASSEPLSRMRKTSLSGGAKGDRRGASLTEVRGAEKKKYAYGCSPYKAPRPAAAASSRRSRHGLPSAQPTVIDEAPPLPPWRYTIPGLKSAPLDVKEKVSLKQLALSEPCEEPPPCLSDEVLSMNSDMARDYIFASTQVFDDMRANPQAFVLFFSQESMAALSSPQGVGAKEMHAVLLACGANPKIINEWIVWKLACMERRFPHQLGNKYLKPHKVLLQLMYRYEREVNRAHRSALKIILERDESAGRSMVLCVAAIRSYGGETAPQSLATADSATTPVPCPGGVIEVTDGWYSINAHLDELLTQHMALGKIYPGLKLRVVGARLTGSDNAVSPLEATESTALLLQFNSVRRALWHSKLGIQKQPIFPVTLKSVRPEGGLVPCIDVVVERRYPMLFLEKRHDGSFVSRTTAQEEQAQRSFEDKRNRILEAKRQELEREAEMQTSKVQSRSASSAALIADCYDGEALLSQMEKARDPYEFQQLLNTRQQSIVQQLVERSHLEKLEDLNQRLVDFAAENPDTNRAVTPYLRLRLRDCPGDRLTSPGRHTSAKYHSCVLTIWRPEEDNSIIEEGARLRIYFVTPRVLKPTSSEAASHLENAYAFSQRPRVLELNTTVKTRYSRLAGPSRVYKARQVRDFAHLHEINYRATEDMQEIDVVGVVVGMNGPETRVYKSGRPYLFTSIFLTDASGELLCINMRENPEVGVSRFPFKTTPTTPVTICVSSLFYRSYDAGIGLHSTSAEETTDIFLRPKGRSSPFVGAYNDLTVWVQRSLDEVEAARERVAALLSGQLHLSDASLPPRGPKRAFLAGALLPFSGIACYARVPSSHHNESMQADHEPKWDFLIWPPACAAPPRLSADSTPDSAVHLLLDDGRQWHRLALSLSTLATVLDILRPPSTLSPVEDWLKGCLSAREPSSSVPTREDGAEAESSLHQRRDLCSKIFGAELSSSSSTSSSSATLEHILRVALLHSRVSTGQLPDLELPGLPLLAEHPSAHHGDGGDARSSASHPAGPLLLSADEWSQFVAALSFGLSRAFDDLQWECLSLRGDAGGSSSFSSSWVVQSVRQRRSLA